MPAARRGPPETLGEIVLAIKRVETLRSSDDPILAGPAPSAPAERRNWFLLREQQILVLESALDDVRAELERGHAPELQSQPWTLKLMSCVTACERFFEERVRIGDERATNLDLARVQWERVLAAAEALEALVALGEGAASGSPTP